MNKMGKIEYDDDDDGKKWFSWPAYGPQMHFLQNKLLLIACLFQELSKNF